MEAELMTLKEAARHLRLAEKTVGKLAQTGAIPANKVAREWRFSRTALDAWQSHRGASRVIEQRLPAEATGLPEPLTVAGAIDVPRIKLHLLGATKDGVLHELVDLVIDPPHQRYSEVLFEALKAREDLCPTCVTEGVAIPHARNALVGLVDRPLLAYGRCPAGIDFGAFDHKPVYHFFLLCAPNVREHLQLLSRLSRLLNQPSFRAKLTAAKNPEDVIALIQKTEQSLTFT
jgi:excisionase family DNA binding protein